MKADVKDGAPPASAMAKVESRPMAAIQADERGNVSADLMIVAGIERGLSPEQLRELVALKHSVEDRNAARAFADAIAALQDQMPAIKKVKTAKIATTSGGSYSYTYAPLDEIVRVLRPLARKHGFSFTWDQEELKDGRSKTTLRIKHVDGHEQTNSFTLPTASKSAMSEQQKQAAANTFAKRQTLVDGFGLITTDEDLDAAEPQDPTPITEDQLTVLEDLVRETTTDRARFLKWLDVESLEALPATQYQQALSALNQKKRSAQ